MNLEQSKDQKNPSYELRSTHSALECHARVWHGEHTAGWSLYSIYLWLLAPFIIIMVGAMPQNLRGCVPVMGVRALLSTVLPQDSYGPGAWGRW